MSMSKGITVSELLYACGKEVAKGNGNKIVMISSDNEGNEYHTLWYTFLDNTVKIKKMQGLFHENRNPDEVVILG